MKLDLRSLVLVSTVSIFGVSGCVKVDNNPAPARIQASPSPSATQVAQTAKSEPYRSRLTLPVLDALLTDQEFVSQLKTKLQITEEQIEELKNVATTEVDRLRTTNAEESTGKPAEERARASEQVTRIIGAEKAPQLARLADEFWEKGSEADASDNTQRPTSGGPNSVPSDTRIVANIPAYRMDLFKNGSLVKSYKIGIGYPEFPLPQGLRKAQTIIFNPTWTPPDSPWVAKMKNVTPGEKIEAGSKLNPLGPIKVPIGMPSLIHGGKSTAKLGTFASHGCVGLTNAQVKDFALMLSEISGTKVTQSEIAEYLKDPTQTKTVKLQQTIPVELRYETIVLEDGALHIYKDVYEEDTNTEEKLHAVLEANGSSLDQLSESEKSQVLAALNQMSAHPSSSITPTADEGEKTTAKKRSEKKVISNKKEIVIQLVSLASRGYPAPVNYDTGSGKSRATALAR
jgi:lipoprotein-anchoring transpeptidase ErfK/SrfK